MITRLCRAAGAATLALAVVLPLHGQSVLLRMNPDEGLVSRYVVGSEVFMDNPMMPSDGPISTTEMFQTQTVLSVVGDIVEMRTVIDSSTITSGMPGMPAGMPDMDGMASTIKIDTRGRVIELSDVGELPPEAQQMISQLGGGGFFQLPEDPVGPGDTWIGNLDLDLPAGMGGSMTLDMNITYTLVSIDGDLASVSFAGPITMSGSAQGMTMDGTGDLSGTAVFDVAKGRVQDTDSQMGLDLSVAGMTMAMETNNTMHLIP